MLRPGALPVAALRALVPDLVVADATVADEAARHSPGQDAIHYAPRAPLPRVARRSAGAARRRHSSCARPSEPSRPDAIVLPDDAAEYGRALFATLHALDDAGAALIAVESPPDDEAWLAVADRLRRAAARNSRFMRRRGRGRRRRRRPRSEHADDAVVDQHAHAVRRHARHRRRRRRAAERAPVDDVRPADAEESPAARQHADARDASEAMPPTIAPGRPNEVDAAEHAAAP